MEKKEILRTLRRARNALRRRKLCQGGYCKGAQTNPTHLCAFGALNFAMSKNAWVTHPDHHVVAARLQWALSRSFLGITDFNDDEGTTKRKVIALFNRAIKLVQKET